MIEERIGFSEKYLPTTWLRHIENYYIQNQTIVVNFGNEKAQILGLAEKYLHPRTSTILKEVTIINGDSLLLIELGDKTNIETIALEPEWNQLGQIADFPINVPLYKSPQYDLGIVSFDPYFVTGMSEQPEDYKKRDYLVKVTWWFAPAKTNCTIHKHHTEPEILEIHTQIYGVGRMQKFRENDFNTLDQDVIMSPGETHIPFASVGEDAQFVYPWHQYYSDTDCIWMAHEFHPI
ncbi:hypothetical protein IQ269_06545 [Tychonema sp. LEGE 07199]|uniref:hypothetical protein n=1 Tax=unclassified Tychonema TaxID=2642144 RepID=UPI001882E1F2|nr:MULTISPECIES: hypothetical protein [unclassified Tychonema]MBE9120477.1 hypothetical protein [Tychonema sp. LEGE 07199]MBE9133186.1 hypothetical protein [Tychonema sp. LEGE 07196]